MIYISPNCPPEVEVMIRTDGAKRGESVMPPRPFPWNRKAVAQLLKLPSHPAQAEP